MLDLVGSTPLCVKLHSRRRIFAIENGYGLPRSHLRTSLRKYSYESFEPLRVIRPEKCSDRPLKLGLMQTSLRCICLGSLVDGEGAVASDLVSVSDQLLLMASILLTYMAGVIPTQKTNFISQKKILDYNTIPESSRSSGSDTKSEENGDLKHAWDAVKGKILGSLDAIERGSNLCNRALEFEQQQTRRPLSLGAVSYGPKLRLLWASFQQLEKEVNDIFDDCDAINTENWLKIVSVLIEKSYQPVCVAWLVEELRLNNKSDMALVSLMSEKLEGYDTVLQNIRKSGKEDLYAELLYFLRFGSLRKNCCYDCNLLILHGEPILEDLVITLADGIASAFLELISVDGDLSNEVNGLSMSMCNLSTRALQRLRNEVALNQWLYQNLEAVVSMYEDRFDLCTLQLKVVEESGPEQSGRRSWLKMFVRKRSGSAVTSTSFIIINQFSMLVKRTKELRALTGWKYYFSLYLELSDIMMPFLRTIIDKISNAISFFLVTLIGRSLGLIYTGIRQSLRWK